MTDYKKLVKALRCCKIHLPCKECPRYGSTGNLCISDLHDDAAAAIEALQAEKKKTVTQIYYEEQMEWEGRCRDLMYWIADLQKQLPKRGKWTKHRTMEHDGDWYCSVCNNEAVILESCKDRTYKYPYCPNCGAKMTEVQDG